LKDGIVHGAAKHGSDGHGKGGLWGYLEMAAKKYPKEYLKLLAKLLPYHITADKNLGQVTAVNIISAPEGLFLSAEKIRELSGLPPIIEVEPELPPAIEAEPATAIEPEPEVEVAFANVRRLNPFNKDRKP
jgi:hypothetical protein